MKILNEREILLDADDEEPKCIRCDNIECEYLCEHSCGSEHGWWGYERVVDYELYCNN